MLEFETAFWESHPGDVLAGVDEAGRGPLAGPVVAAAVAMPPELATKLRRTTLADLNDSKQLHASKRKTLRETIMSTQGVMVAIGMADNEEIDAINILRATRLAMKRAIEAMPCGIPAHALIDGLPVPGLPCHSTAIVKGDSKSLLIAAASVIAKTERDSIMEALDITYPAYGFAKHKGYPTPDHLAALRLHGPCPAHRRTFGPVATLLQGTLL